ncbi:MBOAT family O-acyltransferase [Aurantibacter sp.]|uniref:MBOAT family O-acyltransferase n=1 Tax=Aurantibacter sp. TaxID=2807103 RepID=UPI0035C83923
MLFTDSIFLYLFLPITLLCYFLVSKKAKNILLLFFSLLFYSFGEKELVLLIIASALIDFICGLLISNNYKKTGLYFSIIFNLSILGYFKYSSFLYLTISDTLPFLNLDAAKFDSVVLPLGISFFTFQTMSYTIDVYFGMVKASKNFLSFLTYVSFFPQLIAGPIVRYSEIKDQLNQRYVDGNMFYSGLERFVIGLSKKLLIANNCALIADSIFNLPQNESSALISWIGIIAYSIQIYFDFSGYSDMAIGLGKLFGFNFPENFNYPYVSKSIKEFWKRWHITLSLWFKDYLYIPLGGNRSSNYKNYINLIIVFLITGLWHGANWTFIIWGLWHGVFIILERRFLTKKLENTHSFIAHFYCLFVVLIGWIIFRSDSIKDAFNYIINLFDFTKPTNYDFLLYYLNIETVIAMVFGISLSIPLFKHSSFLEKTKPLIIVLLFILCSFYVASESYNPFIYFRF